ncbi:enolase C-terminal domain-like protein [Streptomyces antimycoticus]|uniref:enolase C-terminal domain-like protein n=1 Tax=Streptomyces antimycoticus TaxID=68175 RepID=UPI000A386835
MSASTRARPGSSCARVADAGLYFVEDGLAPEDAAHFARLRAASPVPLAMGERFSDPTRFPPLPAGLVIDFARTRISTLGGLTPARNSPPPANCAASGSPRTGRATSAHSRSGHRRPRHLHPRLRRPGGGDLPRGGSGGLPGTIVPRLGAMEPREAPGLGVDFDESAARGYPARAPGP